jgi:hypothetical protein
MGELKTFKATGPGDPSGGDREQDLGAHATRRCEPSTHAVIAGTGRAGTSFLVKFLNRCGLDTDLESSPWFVEANAGHEHALDSDSDLPYVVKDPILFSYCEELDLSRLRIDALIVPMRDLALAAYSRIHQEHLAMKENPSLAHRDTEVGTAVPGGVVYSLDVLDQARILAVGFYKLLYWALANDLPLHLLEFPRMVEDRDYTLSRLWPWLGEHCSIETARRAFVESADPDAVRITRTILPSEHSPS